MGIDITNNDFAQYVVRNITWYGRVHHTLYVYVLSTHTCQAIIVIMLTIIVAYVGVVPRRYTRRDNNAATWIYMRNAWCI